MRDRQREYFYGKLDEHFPGLRARYEGLYGDAYDCPAPDARRLTDAFEEACDRAGVAMAITPWRADDAAQLDLF